jgi:hypothetical protein
MVDRSGCRSVGFSGFGPTVERKALNCASTSARRALSRSTAPWLSRLGHCHERDNKTDNNDDEVKNDDVSIGRGGFRSLSLPAIMHWAAAIT